MTTLQDSYKKLEQRLSPVLTLLQKHAVEKAVTQRQHHARSNVIEQLVQRQQNAALYRELNKLNNADIAHLLSMLPGDKRLLVWEELSHTEAGNILLELPDGIAENLIEQTRQDHVLMILQTLDTNELSEIADLLPLTLLNEAKALLEANERLWLEHTLTYPDGCVGGIMSKDSLLIDAELTVNDAIELVRSAENMPPQTDKLFVIYGPHNQLVGIIPLIQLIQNQGDAYIQECMETDIVMFSPQDDAEHAGKAFERYDLISAPVVDQNQLIIGRLTVESIMDYLRTQAEHQALAKEGLSADTDLFGPILEGAKERWPWLCVNLLTAFLATRFISIFEGTIQQLVALATLMPIVASVGGNTGNQTAALLIRGLAINQVHRDNLSYLFRKELLISLLNGLLWGSVLGGLSWFMYWDAMLGLVLMLAITCNLVLAAFIGISVPLLLDKFDKDPAMGSSVILTFATDSMGFFLFLGLATLILI